MLKFECHVLYAVARPYRPGISRTGPLQPIRETEYHLQCAQQWGKLRQDVGCLSFKTVLSGEECYGIEGRDLVVRRDQFLILNNDQPYSCRIDKGAGTHSVSIFFQK